MNSRIARRLLTGLASIAFASSIALTTTGASSADIPQDCWILVETGENVCVDHGEDLAAAVLEEKGYTMLTSPADLDGTAARGTLTAYNLGAIYDNLNYGGGSYLFQTTDSAICAAGKVYGTSNLTNIGWNDRLSSFQGINGCRGVIFKNSAFSGGGYGPLGASSYVGDDFNDKASSIQWVH